ncbi:hypothetical protein [Kitasatospora sp. NPDC005856]|uniref:hypothetical protein n=1 Tax=Kitasatospora sp. NPDC005856 TaxID=3154566 RepID=UPI0034013AD0
MTPEEAKEELRRERRWRIVYIILLVFVCLEMALAIYLHDCVWTVIFAICVGVLLWGMRRMRRYCKQLEKDIASRDDLS